MAPAASVKVGEMSSKSRLQKIIKKRYVNLPKNKFRILQQSHQNSIIFSATKQREREKEKVQSELAAGLLDGGSGREIVFEVGSIQVQFQFGA